MKRLNELTEKELLLRLLSIESVNGTSDERIIARFISDYFTDCGVTNQFTEIDNSHANVVAKIKGKSEDYIILNGHIDTVPYGSLEAWNTNPNIPSEVDDRIFCRGASDMKSGISGMMYFLGNMALSRYVPEYTLVFLATCDEEKGGLGAQNARSLDLVKNAKLLIIGEPTENKLCLAEKGCIWLNVKAHGKTAHGAYSNEGENAALGAFHLFESIKQEIEKYEHSMLGNATAELTVINSGVANNMVPDLAEMNIDIRTVPSLTKNVVFEIVKKASSQIEKKSSNNLIFDLSITNYRMAMETSTENELVKRIINLEQNKMGEDMFTGINFFSDASILILDNESLPTILFGPGKPSQAHKPNEYIEISEYLKFIKTLQTFF